MLRCFLVSISVIEHEFMILNILSYAINFYFWFMYLNMWIEAANCINFSWKCFLFKKWTFTNAHTNVHWIRANMIESAPNLVSLFLDHEIKIVITNFTSSRSCLFTFLFFFFELFIFLASFCSLLLHLFYVINNIVRLSSRLWWRWFFHVVLHIYLTEIQW